MNVNCWHPMLRFGVEILFQYFSYLDGWLSDSVTPYFVLATYTYPRTSPERQFKCYLNAMAEIAETTKSCDAPQLYDFKWQNCGLSAVVYACSLRLHTYMWPAACVHQPALNHQIETVERRAKQRGQVYFISLTTDEQRHNRIGGRRNH